MEEYFMFQWGAVCFSDWGIFIFKWGGRGERHPMDGALVLVVEGV